LTSDEKEKAFQILHNKAGKIQSYLNVFLNHFSCKSILTECRELVTSMKSLHWWLFIIFYHFPIILLKKLMKTTIWMSYNEFSILMRWRDLNSRLQGQQKTTVTTRPRKSCEIHKKTINKRCDQLSGIIFFVFLSCFVFSFQIKLLQ
jgi:hypothetical protein